MDLSLYEELLLLGLDDEKGRAVFSASTALPYGLAGALIMELFGMERLSFENKKIVAGSAASTGDPLLDEALLLIRSAKKNRDMKYWVYRLPNRIKKMHEKMAKRLVDRGILQIEKKKFLWLIPFKRYPAGNPYPELELRERLRSVVLAGQQPDEHQLKLLSLVHACDLRNEIFRKGERRDAKKRIKELTSEEAVGKAISETVAEITAAVAVSVTFSAAVASAGSH